MQSRRGSLVEALVNVAIGMVINVLANMLVYEAVTGNPLSLKQNLTLMLIFTTISIARSYVLRRWFNGRIIKAMSK
jgi:hypothetical protein